jgi:hypothetical protein
MKAAGWIVAASVAAWLVAAALVDSQTAIDVLLGMLAPVAVVSGTWVLMERAYARHPERLTGLMIKAFAGKVVLFGAYVVVMLGLLSRRPAPFIVSFTGSFIVLYACEAMLLRRLLSKGAFRAS